MHHTEIQAIRQRRGAFSASSMQLAVFPMNSFFAASCLLPACPELVSGSLSRGCQLVRRNRAAKKPSTPCLWGHVCKAPIGFTAPPHPGGK